VCIRRFARKMFSVKFELVLRDDVGDLLEIVICY
jgi:hypothetical protein